MSTLRARWAPLGKLPIARLLATELDSTLLDGYRLVARVLEGEGPTIRVASGRMPELIAALRRLGLCKLN